MSRIRTVSQTIEYLKGKDPNTAITEWWIRQNLKNGVIKHHKAGTRYLINLDCLEDYLSNPPSLDEIYDDNDYGTIRKVK